jgi:hypothetical protein
MADEQKSRGRVTRDEGTPTVPRPGDYYVCVVADDKIKAGELVLITKVFGEEIRYVSGDDPYRWNVADFLKHYEFDPGGAERRVEEIVQLMRDVRELQREAVEIRDAEREGARLDSLNQPLLADGETPGGQEAGESGTALIPAREQAAVAVERAKLRAAETRNRVELFLDSVERKKERIRALRKEQEAALEALEGLRGLVSKAEKIIAILNVYLGHDEEIVQIREGEPATAETKISVRQLVLYADEECAINARYGGLDFEDVGRFDEWVSKPENIDQVLPEPRGIVAFKPRRSDKNYGNDVANAYLNALNKRTYFLIRNGERLYRICSTVAVGDRLFPTRTEFDELFVKRQYDFGEHKNKTVRLRPGSREFAEALDAADEKQKEYGTVLLMIQGLIDRTDVFGPFAADYVNVMDRIRHEDFISYVHDAESLLGTGRPPFRQWQEELNARLDVGHRIIGIFDLYEEGLRYNKDGECFRLHPLRAERPANNVLHRIERREGDGFVFYYERHQKIYTPARWERELFREAKVRASCRLEPDDRFFIDFDAVSEDDVRFYLGDRVNRHDYLVMFPLLKEALRLKEEERREEEPFRALLVGQIMRVHGAAREDAEAQIDDLIRWFKFEKAHVHRALKSEDAKAVRMIVHEYGLRLERESERRARQKVSRAVVEAVLAAEPAAIYVGHKRENTYVALVAENDENIFVREQEWLIVAGSGAATMKTERRWRVVDSRRLRWEELWAGGRWGEWRKDARASRFLTDPELEELAGAIWARVKESAERHRHFRDGEKNPVFWPLALVITPEQTLRAWYADSKAHCPPVKTGEGVSEPSLGRCEITWKRASGGKADIAGVSNSRGYTYMIREGYVDERVPAEGERPWDGHRVVWTDAKAVERFDAEWRRARKAEAAREAIDKTVSSVGEQVEKAMRRKIVAAIRERYERDHGAPELWEKHLAAQRVPEQHAAGFRKAVEKIVSRGGEVRGRTVAEIVEEAAGLGVEIEPDEFAALPMEHVVKVRAKK